MIRKALFGGTWYPQEKKDIEKYLQLKQTRKDAYACICPHAGWMYSGRVAGSVFSRIKNYDTYIIAGPNHTGYGPEASIYCEGSWLMPLGEMKIDNEIAKSIVSSSEFLKPDFDAHMKEHSIEVQLPFIQYFNPEAKIVPITLRIYDWEICNDIAVAIAETLKKFNRKNVLLVASTDMTHYEPQKLAEKKDNMAIEKILEMDPEGLIETVTHYNITMCGAFPAAAMLQASIKLGAKSPELVKYTTSAEASGDTSSVVGYAGLIIR